MEAQQSLTDAMRSSSKKEHDRSHSIVLGKLVMVLTSRALYGRALVCFYIVFAELERILKEISQSNDFWRQAWSSIEPINRTAAFEADLQFYLPESWREVVESTKKNNPYVQNYVSRLTTIATSGADHYLLAAYMYHLYLALLAGGSILKKMVRTTLRLHDHRGVAIFEMQGGNKGVRDKIKRLVNGQKLDEDQRQHLLTESSKVFEMNNSVVANFSTDGYMSQGMKLILLLVAVGIVVIVAVVLTSRFL